MAWESATTDHPRLRGEHGEFISQIKHIDGSPPPARGAPYCVCRGGGADGITPACAGSTCCGIWRRPRRIRITPACAGSTSGPAPRRHWGTDHPRLRGEHIVPLGQILSHLGSPPPARGAPRRDRGRQAASRITPACAGSTREIRFSPKDVRDHPRLRGEHGGQKTLDTDINGITPACAGSTRTWRCSPRRGRDHPRLRGEHAAGAAAVCCVAGSPPPARGAREGIRSPPPFVRITPACAGSTSEWNLRTSSLGGSPPPARGARQTIDQVGSTPPGSPPPARGARNGVPLGFFGVGITPACAGSTQVGWRLVTALQDHPRLRGEHTGRAGACPAGSRITPACAGSTPWTVS